MRRFLSVSPQQMLLLSLLALCGCLPSSCQREYSRALLPADSLSRQVAIETPEDTLAAAWTRTEQEIGPLAFPRTVRFGPDGRIYVADAQNEQIVVLDGTGARVQTVEGDFSAPYLAGFLGDTLVVFNPAPARFDFVADGQVRRSVSLKNLPSDRGLLRYGAVWGGGLAFKGGSADTRPFLLRLDRHGARTDSLALPGAFWRHAGLLRDTGDTLLSVGFYRPTAYRFTASDNALQSDTLRLVGFDSPLLARSRLFVEGEVHEPPMLIPAAAPADTLLFLLNARPGWVQVDAYGRRSGRIVRRLIQPAPGATRDFFPIHLDARATEDGYEIVIVFTRPEPRVTMFRW